MKKEAQIIRLNPNAIVVKLITDANELTVLVAALKAYNNGYGNNLFRRIEKQIDKP